MVSTVSEYRKKREKIIKHMGGACVKCGSKKRLEIDHVDHDRKSFNVSQNWSISWKKLKEELAKCQLLCKEHHDIKTKKECSLSKGWTNQKRWKHGTAWGYSKYGCRCDKCKLAKSSYEKVRYKKNKTA